MEWTPIRTTPGVIHEGADYPEGCDDALKGADFRVDSWTFADREKNLQNRGDP